MGEAQGHVAEVNVSAMLALQGLSEPTNESANANASFHALCRQMYYYHLLLHAVSGLCENGGAVNSRRTF